MSWKGNLLKAGLSSNGEDLDVFRGSLTARDGFGLTPQDVQIIDARLATGVIAGSALDIDASVFAWEEGMEMRYTVSDWADVYTLTEFKGMYLRAQSEEASSNSIFGADVYAVANAVNISNIIGIRAYGYSKGASALTIAKMYGLHGEVTWDAGGAQDTISTEAAAVLAKITSGNVADYTKIHGIIVRGGDMDGGSRLFGNGVLIESDDEMSGTSTYQFGVNVDAGTTIGVVVAGVSTGGVLVSGASVNGVAVSGNCSTAAISISGVQAATGLLISATTVDGILISGNCSNNGIEISGDCAGSGILMSGTNGTDIELPNGATIDNNAAGELTITETAIILAGAVSVTSIGTLTFTNGATIANAAALTLTESVIELVAATRIDLDGNTTMTGLLTFDGSGIEITMANGATVSNVDDATNSGDTLTLTEDCVKIVGSGWGRIQFGGMAAGGDWGAGTSGQLLDGAGYEWVTATVGHVDSGALDAACAAAYHALTVTATSHSTASSFFGTWTELYFVTGVDLTGAGNAAAVWGQLECVGTLTTPDAEDFMAAGYFNFKTGGLLTLTTDCDVSGIYVKGEINSITGSGILAAIHVVAAGTDWTYGLYLEDITTGITITDCTTGIALAGAMTDGILISGAMSDNGIEITGVCSGSAILATTATAVSGISDIYVDATYTGTTQWENHNGIVSSVTYTPAAGSGSSMGDAIQGIWRINGIVNAQTAMRGVHGWLHFDTAANYTGTGAIVSALGGEITSAGSAAASGGTIAVLHLACSSTVLDLTDAGLSTFIFVDADMAHAGMDSVMHISSWTTPYFINVASARCGGMVDTGVVAGGDCVGHIKIKFEGSAAYINVYSDNS